MAFRLGQANGGDFESSGWHILAHPDGRRYGCGKRQLYVAGTGGRQTAGWTRSDIFSLGLVMYEMLTGRRAFEHSTAASTMAAVLRDDPSPISTISTSTPRELERVVA